MKKLLLSTCILMWIIGVSYILMGSNQLKIHTLHIEQTNYVPKKAVEDLLYPLKKKHIVYLLFSSNLSQSLKDRFQQIDDISYHINWPNTVTVVIKEKKEWGLFITNDLDVIVAEDGTILNRDHKNYHLQRLDDLIIIRGLSETLLSSQKLDSSLIHKIKKIRQEIESVQENIPIQYQFNAINELSLVYNDEVVIKLGELTTIKQKFKQLNQYLSLKKHPLSQINYIDLRNPNKVVVSYGER